MNSLTLARGCLIVACMLLLFETSLGCFYVLGIGFSTMNDVILDLCLTMAFPVFLISLRSVRGAAVSLWIFFAIQWIEICSGSSPHLVNPLAWIHGSFLFAAAILVSISDWILSWSRDDKRPLGLLGVFGAGSSRL